MRIEKKTNDQVIIELDEEYLRLIVGSLREVAESIDDFEFHARVGGQKKQVNDLCISLIEEMERVGIDQ